MTSREVRPTEESTVDAPVAFTAALMAKDLELALDLAAAAGLPLPAATAARPLADACAAGHADSDFSCVARLLRPTR